MNKYIKALSFRRTFARPEDAIDFLKQTIANRTDDSDDPYGLSTLQNDVYVKASVAIEADDLQWLMEYTGIARVAGLMNETESARFDGIYAKFASENGKHQCSQFYEASEVGSPHKIKICVKCGLPIDKEMFQ